MRTLLLVLMAAGVCKLSIAHLAFKSDLFKCYPQQSIELLLLAQAAATRTLVVIFFVLLITFFAKQAVAFLAGNGVFNHE